MSGRPSACLKIMSRPSRFSQYSDSPLISASLYSRSGVRQIIETSVSGRAVTVPASANIAGGFLSHLTEVSAAVTSYETFAGSEPERHHTGRAKGAPTNS